MSSNDSGMGETSAGEATTGEATTGEARVATSVVEARTASFERAVTGIGSLSEPVRRDLYRYVCARDEPVGREEVAEATGIAHHKVKFHLDRLAADGLLEVDYQRLGDRTGPGAGRPSKVYRPVDEELSVSLPAREYALAGELLAAAVDTAAESGRPVLEVLTEVATARGVELARAVAETQAQRRAADAAAAGVAGDTAEGGVSGDTAEGGQTAEAREKVAMTLACEVLARHGFEPRPDGDRVLLSNCPFHALAQRHTQLVCGMNHAMLEGFTGELAPTCLTAHLDPAPGRCCVTLTGQGVTAP